MGKATGFMDYERVENVGEEPLERIKTYREFLPIYDRAFFMIPILDKACEMQ